MNLRNENSNKRLKEQPTSIVIPVHNVIDFDTFEFSYPKESAKISAKRLTIYEKLSRRKLKINFDENIEAYLTFYALSNEQNISRRNRK